MSLGFMNFIKTTLEANIAAAGKALLNSNSASIEDDKFHAASRWALSDIASGLESIFKSYSEQATSLQQATPYAFADFLTSKIKASLSTIESALLGANYETSNQRATLQGQRNGYSVFLDNMENLINAHDQSTAMPSLDQAATAVEGAAKAAVSDAVSTAASAITADVAPTPSATTTPAEGSVA